MKLLGLLLLLQCFFKVHGRDYAKTALKILQQYSEEIFDAVDNSSKCVEHLKVFLADLQKLDTWTVQMLDASGKLQPGIYTGNVVFLGNYDECLDIDVTSNGSRIQGQYCSTTVKPTYVAQECANKKFAEKQMTESAKVLADLLPYMYMNWDVCIPAACSANDLQKLWNFTEDRYQIVFHLIFEDGHCSTVEKQSTYSEMDTLVILCFCAIGGVVLLSTAYDVLVFQRRNDKEYNFFMAFSFYTNGKRLLSTKSTKATHITCLYGLKTISMMWIIVSHRYLLGIYGSAINNLYFLEWMRHDENMVILGAFACVDTYFVISGFLIVYTIMLAKEMGVTINILVFWGHRFLRLTPSLVAIVLLYMGILTHLGSGPFWYNMNEMFKEPCTSHWWSTVLYIQNYAHPLSTCITHSWYLAVDTQLYILSPLIYFPLQRWPKLTAVFILGLIGASVAAAIYTTLYYDISELTMGVLTNYYQHLYTPTHIRMTPWLIGTLLGYVVIKTKNKNIVIKKIWVYLLWIISLGLMIGVAFGYMAFLKYKFTTLTVALYIGFSRIIWAICISWIIFACTRGYGGYIQKFLSLPIFQVISRITYSLYLLHLPMIFMVKSQIATHSYVDNLFNFHEFWGDFAFSIGAGTILTLTFESPVTILENVLTKWELKRMEKLKGKVEMLTSD